MPADFYLPGETRLARIMGTAVSACQRSSALYLLSALLMLAGCYAVCAPYLFEIKDVAIQLRVPLVLTIYEFILIVACGWLVRRAPNGSEAKRLLWIEMLFLLDATFTFNACLRLDFLIGSVLSIALSITKLQLFDACSGERLIGRLQIFLIPALMFIYSFQALIAINPSGDATNYAAWLLLAATVLFVVPALKPEYAVSAEDSPSIRQGWWLQHAFRRNVAIAFIVGALLQLLAQMWVYEAPTRIGHWLPLGFALLTIWPALFPRMDAVILRGMRLFFAFDLLLIALFDPQAVSWPLDFEFMTVACSPLRLTLLFAGAAFLLAFAWERTVSMLRMSCLLLLLAVLGHDTASMRSALAHPTLGQAALAFLPVLLWLRYEDNFSRGLCILGGWLGLAIAAMSSQFGLQPMTEIIRYWPLMALLYAIASGEPWSRGRRWCVLVIVLTGCVGFRDGTDSSLAYFYIAFATLAATIGLHRGSIPYFLGYILIAHFPRGGSGGGTSGAGAVPLPAISWGWLAILLAFVALGCALLLTKRSLDQTPPPPAPPSIGNDAAPAVAVDPIIAV